MKTFLHWEGNKSKYLKYIYSEIPEKFNTYIEPFVGSGAVFLHLKPKRWIINDINKDVISAWNLVKNNFKLLAKSALQFGGKFNSLSTEERLITCKDITDTLNTLKHTNKRTINYLLMKSVVFMGHIIVRNKYQFTSLSFKYNTVDFPMKDRYINNVKEIHTFLNETNGLIENKDYKDILKRAKKNDFVFLDPPYIEEHKYGFKYNKDEDLNTQFLKSLLEQVKKLDKKGVRWMMTQADTEDVKQHFKDYNITSFPIYRYSRKRYEKELIIKNY